VDIPLGKINLFFGPNNAGKSALLSAITLLSQTMYSHDRDVPLLCRGHFEDLGSYKDLVYGNNIRKDIKIGIEIATDVSKVVKYINNIMKRNEDAPIKSVYAEFKFTYRSQQKQIALAGFEIQIPTGDTILRTRIAKTASSQLTDYLGDAFAGLGPVILSRSINLNHFFPTLRGIESMVPRRFYPLKKLDRILSLFTRLFIRYLNSVEFISPFRQAPERFYTFSGESPSTVGIHGETAIDVLVADHLRRGKKRRGIKDEVARWFQQAEIAKQINIVPLSDRHYEVKVTNFYSNENQSIADVGFGCSQVLPVLVAGFSLHQGDSFIVEEPEIHLHPKAQAELGTFLLELAQRDIQLFIETHSEHLLLRLQSHVASGELAPNEIFVYYIYADPDNKKKNIKRINIGRDGIFIDEWPHGFFPEKLHEAMKIAGFKTT